MAAGDPDSAIDQGLHDRVVEEIRNLTEALDAEAANPGDEALDELRAAVDRLMRALGRVLIEIERRRGARQPDD